MLFIRLLIIVFSYRLMFIMCMVFWCNDSLMFLLMVWCVSLESMFLVRVVRLIGWNCFSRVLLLRWVRSRICFIKVLICLML